MSIAQPGILDPIPALSRYLFFTLKNEAATLTLRAAIERLANDDRIVIGLGASLIEHLGGDMEQLPPFPACSHRGIDIPATPHALWCWLRGEDRGELLHRSRDIEKTLNEGLSLDLAVDGFRFADGRDLTGYEDGTENPEGEEAVRAAITHSPEQLQGSSFVAVQQWLHDLDRFESMPSKDQDNSIGRRISDNEEIDDAPESAHVKRTAQESFEPEAFMVRRSMPWSDAQGSGLMFVCFGHSLDAFEAQLNRMVGLDDGVTDALFKFTRPITGSYYWCPPLHLGRLDLSALDT